MEFRLLGEKKLDHWIVTCLELNLVAQGTTDNDAFDAIREAIGSYLKTVFDTDDILSIPEMLDRPAPLSVHIKFWIVNKISKFHNWRIQLFRPSSLKLQVLA